MDELNKIPTRNGLLGPSKTRGIALIAVFAGAYTVATISLGTISYGVLNLRLTNIIIGVVPILGLPSAVGLSFGVFFANIFSPLGPIDLLSSFFALAGLVAVYFLRNRSVAAGLGIHSVVIGIWVTFELSLVTGLPFFPLFYAVWAGNVIVDALAYFFYKALAASGLKKRLM